MRRSSRSTTLLYGQGVKECETATMNKRLNITIFIAVICSQLSLEALAEPIELRRAEHNGYTLWMDCERRGASYFRYDLKADNGSFNDGPGSFTRDEELGDCQPSSGDVFTSSNPDVTFEFQESYDRGHLVAANHLDGSAQLYAGTYQRSNMLPQESSFNRNGAWAYLERQAECYRDLTGLIIYGGVIWGFDKSNDWFIDSHGVETPDYWWRLHYRRDTGTYDAWLMANSATSDRNQMERYRVSISELVAIADYPLGFEREILDSNRTVEMWNFEGWNILKCEGTSTSNR